MDWQIIVALVVFIPLILLPVAFVWFLNLGGVYMARRAERKRRAVEAEATKQTG